MAAAVQCEFDIWNVQIFSKYFDNLDQQKYLDSVLKDYVQLVPSTLSASFPQPVWIATDSLAIFAAAEDCIRLAPKYELKAKLKRRKNPNLFIWNNSGLRKWQYDYRTNLHCMSVSKATYSSLRHVVFVFCSIFCKYSHSWPAISNAGVNWVKLNLQKIHTHKN